MKLIKSINHTDEGKNLARSNGLSINTVNTQKSMSKPLKPIGSQSSFAKSSSCPLADEKRIFRTSAIAVRRTTERM